MLRITTEHSSQVLTLRLEGRLEGAWVEVLKESWRGAMAGAASRRRCVDLNGVTFIDGKGRARLAEMHAQGAELLAEDLETRAIVAEIVGQSKGST
jgi:anti-anti-sigma regulatory factor